LYIYAVEGMYCIYARCREKVIKSAKVWLTPNIHDPNVIANLPSVLAYRRERWRGVVDKLARDLVRTIAINNPEPIDTANISANNS
jgi:hypothetical protein